MPLITKKARRLDGGLPYEEILSALREAGLHFSDEAVANYLLALQAKRFVILTGISGTGKTKLAMALAECFQSLTPANAPSQAPEGVDNRCAVPVHPDWTDNHGLLGYYNPLIGSYVTTPFLERLLEARDECERAEREGREPFPFFVVLHTYRDAVPSARSVWVLYPGSETRFFRQNGAVVTATSQLPLDALSGVGAVPLYPAPGEHTELRRLLGAMLG